MLFKVSSELFEDRFLEMALLWEYLKKHNLLASIHPALLLQCCSRTVQKLSLRWLDVVRWWTCEELGTEETKTDTSFQQGY